MPRPTGRGYALLGLAAATYVAARVLGTWELYLFAFAFLATVIVSWLLVAATGRRVHVERHVVPERPVAGDEPEISLVVQNRSIFPGPQLTLRNRLAGLADGDLDVEMGGLGPRAQRKLHGRLGRVNRGVHVLHATEALAEDPLGVARAGHRVSEPLQVTVYPRIALLDSCALYPEIGLRRDWSGQHGLLTPGASEFRGIRPHQPGEPLSHIDWKSTAKTGVLMLREMEEPAGSEITLLLDGTAAQVGGDPPDSNFELAVRAAGSVVDYALRAGRNVNLLLHERMWQQTRLAADGGGRRDLLDTLAEAQPDASAPLINALRHLHDGGTHLLRAQSVTVVSMSLDHRLVQALVTIREGGARLAVLYVPGRSFARASADASTILPFLPPRDDPARYVDSSDRIDKNVPSHEEDPHIHKGLTAEDRSLLLSLASAGIPSITLEHGDDLVRSLSLWQTARRHSAAGR